MGTHVPYGITQCYMPPGRGDIFALTPAEAGTRFSVAGRMVAHRDGISARRRSPIPVLTGPDVR